MRIPLALLALALALVLGLAAGPAGTQTVQISKLALMTFEGDLQVEGTPEGRWAALTGAKTAQGWQPVDKLVSVAPAGTCEQIKERGGGDAGAHRRRRVTPSCDASAAGPSALRTRPDPVFQRAASARSGRWPRTPSL